MKGRLPKVSTLLPNEKICQLRTAFIGKRNRIERCVIRAFSLSKFPFQAPKWLDSLCKSTHRQNAPCFSQKKDLNQMPCRHVEAFRIIRIYAFKGGGVKPFARPEKAPAFREERSSAPSLIPRVGKPSGWMRYRSPWFSSMLVWAESGQADKPLK